MRICGALTENCFIYYWQKYLNPLKSSDNLRDIVDTQLVDEIFYMVPSILGIHERFLEELHKRLGAWDCNQKVGDAFIDVVCRI